jgi:hypothetical protein
MAKAVTFQWRGERKRIFSYGQRSVDATRNDALVAGLDLELYYEK